MSTTNVNNEGAKDKIKELAESIDMCMMGTNFTDPPLHVIPMSTKKVDDQGNIWFLSNKNSNHNAHIKKDARTQLIYANPKGMEFMTLFGNAQITMERSILKDLYGKSDDQWGGRPKFDRDTNSTFRGALLGHQARFVGSTI